MSRQPRIVVLSGKTGSGKSALAALLGERFNFLSLRTRDILISRTATKATRAQLLAKGRELDHARGPAWVIDEVKRRIAQMGNVPGVVIDHVTGPVQLTALRREFGNNLTHIHLWASAPTLRERYGREVDHDVGEDEYNAIDHLRDQADVLALKHDADVRINTDQTDQTDTLTRVAARLGLYAPPDVRCVDVVIGGQYGSEGKGNVVGYLAREYDVMVRVGGPNAGHTVAHADGTYTYHLLPSGSRDVRARILLGPGMTISLDGLLKEVDACKVTPDRLFIDPQAMIIEDEDREAEKSIVDAIASTGSGSGEASARRIRMRGKGGVRLARDVPELEPYVGYEGNWRGSTADRLEAAYLAGHSILLEGTQGSGLSIFHGQYPYVTSRDTNVAGTLAEAGISPSRVRRILMVIRPTPIRVGNAEGPDAKDSGPLKHETTFMNVAIEAELDPVAVTKAEITSTTKRKRRVGWFEWDQFRRACAINAPTDIVLAFADYVEGKNRAARRFDQLGDDTIDFIEELERVAQAPVSIINTRFPREDDGTGDLRTVIDRRNWTGHSHS
jgi:adenylosuccinate synthase